MIPVTTHISEEQMVMLYYGEEPESTSVSRHLEDCEQCRNEFRRIQQWLINLPVAAVPERGEEYGAQVWQKVRARLPGQRTPWWNRILAPRQSHWALAGWAGAMAVMLVAAFLAGKWGRPVAPPPVGQSTTDSRQAKERVVLAAVGDHLEQSQMMLVELMNSDEQGKVNIAGEQKRARELLNANRLYRQSAERVRDPGVNKVLDDLERVLLEVANGPSELDAGDVEQFRKRMEAQGILFEMRVVGSRVRERKHPAPAQPAQGKT